MEKINSEKITKFLMKYWWIWLVLLVISSLFLIFGRSVIGSFLTNLFWNVLAMAFVFFLHRYTFGNSKTKTWGIFRLIGILGTLFFSWGLFEVFKISFERQADVHIHPYFSIASIGLICSFLFFSIGEILNYLEHIHHTNEKIAKYSFDNKQENQNMICPRCLGKGFVDLNDIKRLGMEKDWEQGYCQYCSGQGDVEKGKTILEDPRIIKESHINLVNLKLAQRKK
jgi:hypothetical protein